MLNYMSGIYLTSHTNWYLHTRIYYQQVFGLTYGQMVGAQLKMQGSGVKFLPLGMGSALHQESGILL